MTTVALVFLAACFLAICMTQVVIQAAADWGVLDRPDNYRKIHVREVPRLGGMAVYVAFFVPILIVCLFPVTLVLQELLDQRRELLGLWIGGTLALAMGIADDVSELRSTSKLAIQVIAATHGLCPRLVDQSHQCAIWFPR